MFPPPVDPRAAFSFDLRPAILFWQHRLQGLTLQAALPCEHLHDPHTGNHRRDDYLPHCHAKTGDTAPGRNPDQCTHVLFLLHVISFRERCLLLSGVWRASEFDGSRMNMRRTSMKGVGGARLKKSRCTGTSPVPIQGTLRRCPGINLRCAAVDGPAPRPPRVHLGVVGPVSGPLFARGFILHGRTRANRCKV